MHSHLVRIARRVDVFFVLIAFLLLISAGCGGEGGRDFLSIGTGGTGGIYYPLGGALASRLSAQDEGRRYTAEVTGGSVENMKRLRQGQLDLAFVISTTAYGAYFGDEDFPDGFENARIVAPLYPNVVHALVARGSRLGSLQEFRGQRISVGSAGSGTEQVSRDLLQAFDLSYADIRPHFLSFSESSAGLRDGSIEAALISVGYPAAAVMEATTTGAARLIALEGPPVEALIAARPYFFASVIPAGAYRGVDADIATVAELNWLIARSDLPDDVVHRLLDILKDERAALERVTDIASQIDLTALRAAPIPVHDAAREWLEANFPER